MHDRAALTVVLLGPASSVHTRRWASALADAGHRIIVASWQLGEPLRGVDVRIAPAPGAAAARRVPLAARWLRGLIADVRPDVVHVHSLGAHGLLSLALPPGPARVVTPWGSELHAARHSAARAAVLRLALRQADLVLPTSAAVATEVTSGYAVPPARTRVLSWAFACAAADRPDLFLVVLGGHRPDRESARRAKEGYLDRVRDAASTLGDRLLIVERTLTPEQTFELMCASDIAVSIPPSDQRSSSVLEAALAGCRLLLSRIAPYQEMISDGLAADLVPEPVRTSLTELLRRASVDEASRRTNLRFILTQEHGAIKAAVLEGIYRQLSART